MFSHLHASIASVLISSMSLALAKGAFLNSGAEFSPHGCSELQAHRFVAGLYFVIKS